MKDNQMRITVNDIAKELNIAQGTVSKALSGKKGVNPHLREEVLKTAERLGYKVNRIAQTLARAPITIGLIYPDVWQEYYGFIVSGINLEITRLQDYNLKTVHKRLPSLFANHEINDAVTELINDGVDAILLCPASSTHFEETLKKLQDASVPAILVGADMKGFPCISCIHIDAVMSGFLAAEFMHYIIPAFSDSAVLIGSKAIREHSDKADSYSSKMKELQHPGTQVYETQDDPGLAYDMTKNILRTCPDIKGIYVATDNSVAVCRCLEDEQACERISVIGTDIFDEMLPYIDHHVISAVLFQNPVLQGRLAIRALYKHISEHNPMPEHINIAPNLVLQSNIRDFTADYSMFL